MQTRKIVAVIGLVTICVPAAVLVQVVEVVAASVMAIVAVIGVIGAIVMVLTVELVDRAVGMAVTVVQAVAVMVEDLVVDAVVVHGLELVVQEREI